MSNINTICYCKNTLNSHYDIVMLIPCCHFVHEHCINKLLINNKKFCLICKKEFTEILTENKIMKHKNKQHKIDLLAVKQRNAVQTNYSYLPNLIMKLTNIMNKLMLIKTHEEIMDFAECILLSCNIKINILDNTKNNPIIYKNSNVMWKNKVDNDKKITIIGNHTGFFDSVIIYYLFQCGFVSSDFINTFSIGKIFSEKCNLLIFKRGENTGMVEKIKEYLKKNSRICMFPEGVISHNNTLIQFRTGAFYASENVCPVVLKYSIDVHDEDVITSILKVMTQQELVVDVIINDLVSAPFNNEMIEQIRLNMAKVGKLKLSNVSNKNITD